MKPTFLAIFTLVTTLSASATEASGKFVSRADGSRNRYLVMLADSKEMPTSIAGTLAARFHGKIRYVYQHALRGFAVEMSERNARALSADARVKLVEQDSDVHPTSVETGAPTQWALDRIDQRTGLNGQYVYNKTGLGVRVYVIDSGVIRGLDDTTAVIDGYTNATCPQPTYSAYCYCFVYPPCNSGFPVYDDETCNSGECHGTKVASIISGANVGVAKNATVINVRVYPYGGVAQASDVAGGLDWVVYDHQQHPNNPAVANISLDVTRAGSQGIQAFEQAVINAIDAGVVIVCGAGNTDTVYPIYNDQEANACNSSPARLGALGWGSNVWNPHHRTTITVSATSDSDERVRNYPIASSNGSGYDTSNTGPCVDIFAPGWYVRAQSTYFGTDQSGPWFSGTSAASPYVAGVVALYLEGRGANYDPDEVEAALKRNATSGVLGNVSLGAPNLFVYGRVDLWQ